MSLEQAVAQLAEQLKKSDSPTGKQHQELVKAVNAGFERIAKAVQDSGNKIAQAIKESNR